MKDRTGKKFQNPVFLDTEERLPLHSRPEIIRHKLLSLLRNPQASLRPSPQKMHNVFPKSTNALFKKGKILESVHPGITPRRSNDPKQEVAK
eukprot:3082255-Amphidinium_carterae.1